MSKNSLSTPIHRYITFDLYLLGFHFVNRKFQLLNGISLLGHYSYSAIETCFDSCFDSGF